MTEDHDKMARAATGATIAAVILILAAIVGVVAWLI